MERGQAASWRSRNSLARPGVSGLSYSVGAGQTTAAINTILSRKATVYDSTLFVAGPLGPGPGVHQV